MAAGCSRSNFIAVDVPPLDGTTGRYGHEMSREVGEEANPSHDPWLRGNCDDARALSGPDVPQTNGIVVRS